MSRNFKYIFLFFLICFCGTSQELRGQVSSAREPRTILIGELIGRTDAPALLNSDQSQVYYFSTAQQQSAVELIYNTKKTLVFKIISPDSPGKIVQNRLQYQLFDSEWSLISALIIDQIDFARLVSEESAREISKSNRSIHILSELLPRHTATMVVLNCRHPVLNIVEIRQALSYAIDKQGLVTRLLKNRADLAKGPYNKEFDAYEPSLSAFRFNPKRALQVFENHGWVDRNNQGLLRDRQGNTLQMELIYRKGLVLEEDLARWIKINWNQIGIDVRPVPLPYSKIQAKLASRQYDAVLHTCQFEENIKSLERFFSAQGDRNYMGYVGSKVENYLKLYAKIEQPERRKILIQSIQKAINQDQPVIFLYFKWLVFNFINRTRIDNYLDAKGNLRPLHNWIIKKK